MKIDVLICVHSQDDFHDRLLQRALESLVAQTYSDFSTIIILDECWEFTSEIVRKYIPVLDLRFFERPRKMGLAYAKNFGISKCTGDFISYLDADDAWDSEKLGKQVEFIEDNPDYDVIGTQAWDVYNPVTDGEVIKENCFSVGQYTTDEQIKERLPIENVICHGSIMIKRSVLVDVGGYNTSSLYKGREDYALWQLLASKGHKFYNIPERLYYYSMNTSVPR